jgi:hypothetical protein
MAYTSPKTWGSAVLSSPELNTHLRDQFLYICGTNGMLQISGTGPHAVGAAPAANVQFNIAGTFTPSAATTAGFQVNPVINVQANQSAYVSIIGDTLVEAGCGTHPLFAGLRVNQPVITSGAAALTVAAALYVAGVPSGATTNYALYIETGADDGPHVVLSNQDVAHGITDSYPTTIYGAFRKASATAGGLSINGLSEDTGGIQIIGHATNVITTEAGGSRGNVNIISLLKSRTTVTAHAADDNTVVFINGTSATHIFKGNGDYYVDGTGGTFHAAPNGAPYDDAALCLAMEAALGQHPEVLALQDQYGKYTTEDLEAAKLLSAPDPVTGRRFYNAAALTRLVMGPAWKESLKRRDHRRRPCEG